MTRITVYISLLLACSLLVGSAAAPQEEEIKIRTGPLLKGHFTESHAKHVRASLRRMVCPDSIPKLWVATYDELPGGRWYWLDAHVVARLPELSNEEYSIRRKIKFKASGLAPYELDEEHDGPISWSVRQEIDIRRIFQLPKQTLKVYVGDGISYRDAKRVLSAIQRKAIEFGPNVSHRPHPQLRTIRSITREKDGEVRLGDCRGGWGYHFYGRLLDGVFKIRAAKYWIS